MIQEREIKLPPLPEYDSVAAIAETAKEHLGPTELFVYENEPAIEDDKWRDQLQAVRQDAFGLGRAVVEADRQGRGGLVGYIRQADIDWMTAPDRDKTGAMLAYVYKSARYSNEPEAMQRVPVYTAPPAGRAVPSDDDLEEFMAGFADEMASSVSLASYPGHISGSSPHTGCRFRQHRRDHDAHIRPLRRPDPPSPDVPAARSKAAPRPGPSLRPHHRSQPDAPRRKPHRRSAGTGMLEKRCVALAASGQGGQPWLMSMFPRRALLTPGGCLRPRILTRPGGLNGGGRVRLGGRP